MQQPISPSHGRDDELRALRALIATQSLVTLVGPGGIGKTWLARTLFDAHRAEGSVGWFCAAERASSDADLVEALETAVESHTPGFDDIETRFQRVLARLRDEPGLLVIDNLEQLPDAALRVRAALDTGVTVLVTSRHHLHIEGEQIFPVDGLGAAARALFVHRARIVDPRFAAAQPDLDGLLVRLAGVPLAIELAAGRMGSFTPHDILERLERGLARATQPGQPDRQDSIENSYTWSWDLCAPDLQTALGLCTIFEDGFGLDAAESVLGLDAIDRIQSMVDRSLLRCERVHGRARFSMRQLWREFVIQRVSASTRAQATAAHRRWYLKVGTRAAADAHGPDGVNARRWLLTERGNLSKIAATGELEATWVLRTLLHYGGLPAGYAHWVAQSEGPVADLLRGEMALQQGRIADATELLSAALDAIDDDRRWEVLLYLGIAKFESGEATQSMMHHTEAQSAAQAVGNVRGVGRALGSQGATLNLLGELNAARDRYDQAFDALRQAGDTLSLSILTVQIGDMHAQAGRLTEARLAYASGYRQFDALKSLRWVGFVSGKLGSIALEEGKASAAIARCQEAVDRLTLAGCVREAGVFDGYVGVARHAAGDLEGALGHYNAAQTRIRSDRRHCALFASFAAVAAYQLNQPFAYWLEKADALVADSQFPNVRLTLKLNRAHAQATIDPAGAEGVLAEATDEAVGTDARVARRWLAAAIGQIEESPVTDGLVVWPESGRFKPPGEPLVDISRRRILARLFDSLVQARLEHPGTGLSIDELQRVGWPGERMSPISGANRVYVAIATLRSNGLRDLLLKREVGYLLDPQTPLVTKPVGIVG